MRQSVSRPLYGLGLNSIPTRFAVMSLALSGACACAFLYILHLDGGAWNWMLVLPAMAIVSFVPTILIYLAARSLTGEIAGLQASAEAVAAGDLTRPVEVDCPCEIGDLASSFRRMVARLNDNIIMMNARAHTDPVTGLPNRAVLDHLLSLAGNDEQCALLFIDLDGFKAINDSLGHDSGDELLKQVTRRIARDAFGRDIEDLPTGANDFGELCDVSPQEPFFARFGGDEFVVVLPSAGEDSGEGARVAQAILKALEKPFVVGAQEVRVSASVGVAQAPTDSPHPRGLLTLADTAMLEAKKRGKNSVVLFEPALQAHAVEKHCILAELQHAIENGDFVLNFQPKIDSGTLRVSGVEALLRWIHPSLGPIPPGKFIPIAEEAGLMRALGKVVVEQALAQCHKWRAQGLDLPIAVNVSAAQFDDPAFASDFLALLAKHKVPPALLEIEITETMLMADFAGAAARLRTLREAGVAIAIDDFGVGFSNLRQLAKLPANYIKIDRSLIEGIGADPKTEAIVRATINLAHALGEATIAEGIETQEQADFLRRAGCDKLQGFLFARPLPATDLENWLTGHDKRDQMSAA